ncbi:pyruvate formate-lyase 1-activating enzyme [Corynebacterium pseudotuberculosis]|uniref:pyruvate formate-lyase-activating protein n=1 Tax=Corynebacterium pseudotuberculosis TaxID=1719 RepID=UPI0002592575|nr:pyruvate formate-lyase-activating protein [Corynebacterium pseudotuberculosis]AFH90092.1 pyruvate formate lyase-activating protein [Corynebacterium pseudotuberculosis 31]APB10228.1 pyruvate formate-lyase 1-activating enzyme [Corynebacterium pseudotuberculosis]APB12278.1 pyruvate formate-lyase 1-activating enzyme [Corynebacterium pseudotuberculosis]APB14323.1 pyruvate formate-lyase 1-activating enzyme [Corynebacterium pseudotuberculosis]APB16371.1 pyruvate formate-lyase 1-activating enzyme [
MADGINSTVTVERSDGPRLRGTAAGIGTDLELEDVSHKELIEARRTGDIALVHSWELVTAVDGPGTRMTMFTAGCPLRCLYCHNPDTMQMKKGTLERVEDIIKKIKRYRRVFKASGGGLTISGGEPLFQIAFTRRVLKEVHDAGIHTTIDTSGYLGARLSDEDLENIDLVLLDVKAGDEETYRRVTGRELQPTIDFGNRLHAVGKPVWIRFVLVPGLTDSPENINKVADIVEQWKDNVERVEVLPFHNMGADKWHELNLQYDLEDVKPPTEESVAFTKNVFRSRGLLVP